MSRFRLRGRRKKSKNMRHDRIPLRAIVPNLITSLAAYAGITSISLSSEGRYLPAFWALLIACVCDGLDGRVARMLNASSKLGAELDSLADFVNFPPKSPILYIMFFWLTGGPTHVGVNPILVRLTLASALFYAMCDCFRLARFNTMLEQPTLPYWKNFFLGVPAPGGAWMVLSPAVLVSALDSKGAFPVIRETLQNPYFGIFMLLFVGMLMASRLPTISLKAIRIPRSWLLPVLAMLLLLVAFLVSDFWLTLGVIGSIYILTIPVVCWLFLRGRARYERSRQD